MNAKQRALIIDDEPSIRRLLKVAFGTVGTEVVEASGGAEGLAAAAQWSPAFVILDLGLPDIDGLTVLKRLREWYQRPILILSVRNEEENIIFALDQGADDYLTKPFNTGELLARVRVACRHYAEKSAIDPVFKCGHLSVDFSSRQVFVHGEEVRLTSTEYDVLQFFVSHAGRAVTHGQILKAVWGPNATQQNQYLRVYVNHLRKKIEENPDQPKLIRTEPGVGYRFQSPLKEDS
jgi:two-component system, OmpR family, KDP operon response regulator KdpE